MLNYFFPYKYWLVKDFVYGVVVKRARLNPIGCSDDLLDGPFTEQEDAVRALHFWSLQYSKTNKQVVTR